MPAGAAAELHTPERSGSFKRHPPPRLAAWHARLRAPPQSAPPSSPCRRAHRQSYTLPSDPGVPNAIRRQDWRRDKQDCVLHLRAAWPARLRTPPQSVPAKLAMPAAAPAEPHTPERSGSSNADRRQDWRRGKQDCLLHLRAAWQARVRAPPQGGVASKTACSTSKRAAKLAMPAGAAAELHTPEQSGISQRRPPPRLAAWHARLLAPPQSAPAKLAMPAAAPAELHTPERSGSSKRHPPPRLAA